MFLKERKTNDLVEVLNLAALFDPFCNDFKGRLNAGEDLPEPTQFMKADVVFPSGEDLPTCWMNPHYRDTGVHHQTHARH